MQPLRVKGQAFRSVLAALAKLEGKAVYERTVEQLPEAFVNDWRAGAIVSGGWYPVEWYAALYETASKVAGKPMGRPLGRESARADLTGVYRFVTLVLSPESLVARTPKVFSLAFEGAEAEALEARKGYVCIEYRKCAGFTAQIWDDVMAGTEMVIELAGGTDIRGKILAGGGRNPTMKAAFEWTPWLSTPGSSGPRRRADCRTCPSARPPCPPRRSSTWPSRDCSSAA